jgi:cytochrome c2
MRHPAIFVAIFLAGCAPDPAPDRPPLPGNAGRGLLAIRQLDCGACHVIPGIREARGRAGPSLQGFARRAYFAGAWPNKPDHLTRFLRDPPALAPHTLMPRQGIDENLARDIAAYLYGLE